MLDAILNNILHSNPAILSKNNVVKDSGICNSIVMNYVRCNSEQQLHRSQYYMHLTSLGHNKDFSIFPTLSI